MPYEEVLVSFEELVTRLAGRTFFRLDQLEEMIAHSEERGEDFLLKDGDIDYRVPLEKIKEYFETHPRPYRPMSAKEEAEYWRRKYNALLSEFNRLKTKYMQISEKPVEVSAPTDELFPKDEETPLRRTSVNLEELRDELRHELKAELKDKKPHFTNVKK